MKYKVGDKVRVTPHLDESDSTDACYVTPSMLAMRGGIYTIAEIADNGNYKLYANDGSWWYFTEEMLEPVTGFRGGKIPTSVNDESEALEYMANNVCVRIDISDFDAAEFSRQLEEYCNKHMKRKEDNSMGFAFQTIEGYRIDKSNNTKIPTIETEVAILGHTGRATCDKADYDEREGVLNAIANAVCNGSFDKAYRAAVKGNKRVELFGRTCKYCGEVFPTIEERKAHEAWHVERRKARHERYKLRKRAKEIAFEQKAQEMAKEIIQEEK